MRTRIFTLLVAFLAIAGNAVWGQDSEPWNGEADISWYDKNKNEFVITTAEQLAGLTLKDATYDFDNKTIKLGANIILNADYPNYESWETNNTGLKEWSPIPLGSYENFTFDGCGFEVKGLYINSEDSGNKGLFSVAGGESESTNAVIKNLKVTHSFVKVDDVNSSIGGIVGVLYTGWTISNCHFDGEIKVSNNLTSVGGICGSGMGKIESCGNAGNISVTLNNVSASTRAKSIGGICGSSLSNESIITNCFNTGKISVEGTLNNIYMLEIGGIAGNAITYGCYNTGDVYAPISNNGGITLIGGIAGNSEAIKYCYNKGTVTGTEANTEMYVVKVGDIYGSYVTTSFGTPTLEKNYILSTSESTTTGITSATEEQFKSGEVAWNLRGPFTLDDGTTIGYGQALDENGKYIDDESPVLLAFEENEGTEVYQLKLKVNDSDKGTIYRNSKESNLLSEDEYNELLQDAVEKDLVWKDEEENIVVSGNKYTPTKDIALTATIDNVYDINTEVTPEDAGTISVKESAAEGETVSFTVTPKEGYELSSTYYIEEGKEEQVSITNNTFVMPASNITIYAIFTEIETEEPEQPGGDEDDDEDQGNTGIHKPQRPIKYYNIYVDTICPGLNVEVSKDVVQEGHQVSAYLTIQAECDTTGMRFEYKRGLFGYWKDLKELEGVQPGEYIIKNIYTDIYIRALDATLPEEEPTGIDDLEGVKAYAKDGSIYVYTPNREEVMIIGMTGAIIKNEEQVGLQSYSVSRGIYIVRIGEKVFKLKN